MPALCKTIPLYIEVINNKLFLCCIIVFHLPTECVTDSVRLVGGTDPSEGQIELCVSHFWHPVCDDGFTVSETELICKALGYDSGVKGKIVNIFMQ